jgi:acetyltransferase-like isoleucine patch superfamily enzyme
MSKSQDFFVHEQGICESTFVGAKTRIWAFAHVLPGAKIGENCNVCDHVLIENDVVVGDNVTIKSGVQLWDGVRVANNVFIGPNATFANDKRPRSKVYPATFLQTVLQEGASVGANATILPGVTIGRGAMIGAGAVVVKDVPPHAVVVGNPARIVGYEPDEAGQRQASAADAARISKLGVGDCSLWKLPSFQDMRGKLTAIEHAKDLPFVPVRTFLVHAVPTNKVRGEHAHRECGQFLVAVAGSLTVELDDGNRKATVTLDNANTGLYIAPRVWGVQHKFAEHTTLMVYASRRYEDEDYVRDYAEFKRMVMGAD